MGYENNNSYLLTASDSKSDYIDFSEIKIIAVFNVIEAVTETALINLKTNEIYADPGHRFYNDVSKASIHWERNEEKANDLRDIINQIAWNEFSDAVGNILRFAFDEDIQISDEKNTLYGVLEPPSRSNRATPSEKEPFPLTPPLTSY